MSSGEGKSLRNPGDFLSHSIGEPVIVRLYSGVDYHGILTCLDGYMNIALEQTREFVNGQCTNSFGEAFIRGNNGAYYYE
jgi:U6 snRNA-associated Sm-like protein LSm6